jgi:trimeric autotransporter adhesin
MFICIQYNINNTFSISAVLSVLTGLMLFGVCGNIQVYAQPSSSSSAADSSSSSSSSTISPQVKAIMCDPSNPSLKVVNTTEAHVCGIPKTVKPSLSSSSTPSTSAVSSTTTATQQTTKLSVNPIVATPSEPREITTTSNNVAVNTRIAPISNPASKQLSSTTTPTIAPQAIHQQQQQQEQQSQPQILPLTATSNNTIALNNTLATTPLLGPGQLTFLGFHGSDSSSSHSSSSNVKHSSDTKSTHSHSTSSSSSHAKSSSHSDHGGKSSSSMAGSSVGDKVRSIIRHALD